MKRLTSIAAAVFTAAFLSAATTVSAQDSNVDQRTYLTFSGPVQMPGVTLPAGKYTFKLANTALHNVMQVYDGEEQHIIGQWFFVPRNRTTEEMNKANGKPVVTFREMPEGVTPAVQYFFYPTDLTGKEFIYPKDQAVKIAAASHTSVLATDTDVAKGGEAHIFRVNPDGSEGAYDANASASNNTADNSANASAPSDNSSASNNQSQTASLNSSADLNNSPASGPPAAERPTDQSSNNNRPAATSGTSAQNQAAAPNQAPAPRQQAAAQLPKTASPLQLIALIGMFCLAGGFGLRLARATN